MELNKGKFNLWQEERKGSDWLGSSSAEKTLWALVKSKMNVSQQCALANSILNCVYRTMTDTRMEGIIPTSTYSMIESQNGRRWKGPLWIN